MHVFIINILIIYQHTHPVNARRMAIACACRLVVFAEVIGVDNAIARQIARRIDGYELALPIWLQPPLGCAKYAKPAPV